MVEERDKQMEVIDQKTPRRTSMNIDLTNTYKFEAKDVVVEIEDEHYSNFAMIQITDKDAYIDFLAMPGIKKEGKMVIRGTRIFMPHSSAQKLAESLSRTLEIVHKDGGMTTYSSQKEKGHDKKAKSEKT